MAAGRAARRRGDRMAALRRWAAGLSYLGGGYAGWQRLPGLSTLQGTVEAALSTVADQALSLTCAGRTDAGVHAVQQVVHFDSVAARSEEAWLLGSNSLLPADVSLRWVRGVPDEFHARFSAVMRHYRYRIHNARAREALLEGRACWWPRPLDAALMHEAAQVLLGEQDFSAFRDAHCQSPTPMRRLSKVAVHRQGTAVVVEVVGNAFLHHMVRNIVGTLAEVGWGRQPPSWVAEVLAGRDRRRAGMTAPAEGLYFLGPVYPAHFGLPLPEDPPAA
jgi:tRNA pseudouridine38-40 synthase